MHPLLVQSLPVCAVSFRPLDPLPVRAFTGRSHNGRALSGSSPMSCSTMIAKETGISLSLLLLAEDMGLEPTGLLRLTPFPGELLSHSVNPPCRTFVHTNLT